MTSIAVVGIGYWGRNLVRIFSDIAEVSICVHLGSPENERWLNENYPAIDLTTDYESVISDPEIDAIVIATPIETHFQLARDALRYGKHVFVEKPLAESAEEAEQLVSLAEEVESTLFVGFIFLHHPTIRPLFQRGREIGVEWGRFSWDKFGEFNVNVFLDTVSHPIAVGLELFGSEPTAVEVDRSIAVTRSTDIVSSRVGFSRDRAFDINISRLSQSTRKSMQVLYEDGNLFYWDESGLYRFREESIEFDLVKPTKAEPLRLECQDFLEAVNGDTTPRTGGELGYKVNRAIDRIVSSL